MVTNDDLKKGVEILDKKSAVHVDFLKHILLISSSLFGILVALHKQMTYTCIYIRYIFPVSLLLLSLGILCASIALYSELHYLKTLQKRYSEELINALREERSPDYVGVSPTTFFVFVEKAGYIFLILAVLLLAAYSLLIAL